MISRSHPIARSGKRIKRSWLRHGTKRIPKVNKAKQAKKLAAYSAFMRSPEWKVIREAALVRAGYRCEERHEYVMVNNHGIGIAMTAARCPMTTTLTVHHVRYTRFGGRELPRDLKVLCWAHHEATEALKGTQRLWQKVSA